MSFNCEILADSKSPQGHRITTMKITFPRFILAEFNTHRMFSRNSASSRAIPFAKMVKMVEENPFIPIAWQKDHKGMQGTEYFTDPKDIQFEIDAHLADRDRSIYYATRRNERGVTKQLCNRYLEPFMWHTVICTFTEVENFFKLRCPQYKLRTENDVFRSKKDFIKHYGLETSHSNKSIIDWLQNNVSQAEIHIQAIAELMWDAYNESTPKELQAGEWHIPKFHSGVETLYLSIIPENMTIEDFLIKIEVARCARISYQTLGDNPKVDYEADIKLHDMLYRSGHFSPFEHCAKATDDSNWYGNFKGWNQYRKMLEYNERQ